MSKITKIFIVYNNCDVILDEINHSFFGSMQQEEIDIILVDNGSTDRTYQRIMLCNPKRKIKYVRFKDKVDYNIARNKGIELANSEIIEVYSLNEKNKKSTISLGVCMITER